jgi:xanthine dehydrogenase molybdenum-binding subunit
MTYKVIGKRQIRKDQLFKATGTAQYTVDVIFKGMLESVTLKSPYAHARINSIDATEAEKLPGVRAVLTYESDVVLPLTNGMYNSPLPSDGIFYAGQIVAVVAAETREIAEEAIKLIKVDYTPLPAVFDAKEARKPGAPLLHPDMREKHPELEDNVAYGVPRGTSKYYYKQSRGDIEKGKTDADYQLESHFTVQPESHYRPETNSVISKWEGGELKFWVTAQGIHWLTDTVGQFLDLPLNKITGIVPWVGCGFGSRAVAGQLAIYTGALAKMTGRPVRCVTDVDENQVTNSHSIGPLHYDTEGGIKKDGTPTYLDTVLHTSIGGFNDAGLVGNYAIAEAALAVYNYESCRAETFPMWCNLNPSGARRSFGGAEGMFCSETFIDEMLEKIDADPVEWRKKWSQKGGDPVTLRLEWGELAGGNLPTLVRKAADAFGWKDKWKGWRVPTYANGPIRRGVGVAMGMHITGDPTMDRGLVRINVDGTVEVISQGCDVGQGIKSAICQPIAEVFGLEYEQVRASLSDSSYNPVGSGVFASRGTPIVIGVAIKAALDAKRQVFEIASGMLSVKPEELDMAEGNVFVKADPSKSIPLAGVARRVCGIYGTAIESFPKINPVNGKKRFEKSNVAMCAEVEVDTETGGVKLLKATLAGDCGYAINPDAVMQQFDGSIIWGLGFGMYGELVYDKNHEGIVMNAAPNDYKIPTIMEYDNFKSIIHEDPADAPTIVMNLKGVGEGACIPIAPAVANAIYNACGARIKDHPITPDKVLKALGKI